MAKGKVVTGTPVAHTQFSNKRGFDNKNLNSKDTQPGPGPGAPLMTSRTVDDYTAKKTMYASGISPGSLSTLEGKGVLGNLDKSAAMNDSPVPGHGEQPNRRATSKAAEVAKADPKAGLGDSFDSNGVLGRD